MLISYLTYTSSLKMEATYSFGTSVDFQRTTRLSIAEDKTLYVESVQNNFDIVTHDREGTNK
jgi:hypothetical protein